MSTFGYWCSPRTWGWSAPRVCGEHGAVVLPTHVGMVRRSTRWGRRPPSAPHARGDGPAARTRFQDAVMCSPRTWGWSARRQLAAELGRVLPTHVGMVRAIWARSSSAPSAPHARGDGPLAPLVRVKIGACSPRTWGWSVGSQQPTLWRLVLPTHVGMVRRSPPFGGSRRRAPHARGDGPPRRGGVAVGRGCSPRTWGWSGTRPTWSPCRRGAPHARGDGPPTAPPNPPPPSCSPRTWGWSDGGVLLAGVGDVLPTHVGMVRGWRLRSTRAAGAPHARGDGPAPPEL